MTTTEPLSTALMTPAEVARAYNVRLITVARWRRAGILHPVSVARGTSGCFFRYFRAEVEALMKGTPLTAAQLKQLRQLLAKEGWS